MNLEISLEDLLKNGSHFGHNKKRWNPKMEKYIYGEKNGTHIIDLRKSLPLIENALKFADKFEGDKTSLSRLIRDAVNFAGEDDTWADNKKIMLQHTASIDNIRDEDFWSVFPELNQIRDLEQWARK